MTVSHQSNIGERAPPGSRRSTTQQGSPKVGHFYRLAKCLQNPVNLPFTPYLSQRQTNRQIGQNNPLQRSLPGTINQKNSFDPINLYTVKEHQAKFKPILLHYT